MKFQTCALSCLLLSASFVSHAQSAELPTAPHFYGDLGVYSSSHQNLGSWGDGQGRIPVQGVVGYQLRPRLAVQLGVAYSGNSSDYAYTTSYSSYYPAAPSTIIDVAGTYTERMATATLLARYVLTRQAAHRFQADLLGGAKVEYTRDHNASTQTTHDQATPVTTAYEYHSTHTQPLLSLGFGLRYRVAPRLEGVYDFTFDAPIGGSNYYYSSRLQATMTLGLRYHFGPG